MTLYFTNRKKFKGSKYIGVIRSKYSKGYYAKKMIHIDGNQCTIMSNIFKNELDAAKLYDKITIKMNLIKNRNTQLNFADNLSAKLSAKLAEKKKRKKLNYHIYNNTLTNTDKWLVQAKQNFCCNLCKENFANKKIQPDADHIRPLQYGGTNNFDNLQSLCKTCHSWKTQHLDKIIGNMVDYENYDRNTFINLQEKLYKKKYS